MSRSIEAQPSLWMPGIIIVIIKVIVITIVRYLPSDIEFFGTTKRSLMSEVGASVKVVFEYVKHSILF